MTNYKTALVTGAYGTIGRYVAFTLAGQGWNVNGIGHGKWSTEEQKAWGVSRWVEADVSVDSLKALELTPIIIIHCAGSGTVGASLSSPYEDFKRTVATTAAVLEFVRANCPQAIMVYPSSAAVYGVAGNFPMAEDMPLHPVSPYGVHKKLAEELVIEHARLFDLKAAVVRLFSIYGEGFKKQLLWDACQRIAANHPGIFFGTGDETRDWLHASDAAELLVTAAQHSSVSCPVVNGGSGQAVSVREVLNELFRFMGRHDHPEFCGTQRVGDPLHYLADMSETQTWGWRHKVDIHQGLERYVSWFKRIHGLA